MDNSHQLFVNEVVNSLDPVLQRLGFWRENRGLHVVAEEQDTSDDILASWMREPPDGRYPQAQQVVGADGVSVWRTTEYRSRPGYVNVGIGDIFARFEWRTTGLDPDEFAAVIEAYIRRYDNFEIPAYLQGTWTRRQ